MPTDPRIVEYEFDAEKELAMQDRLENIGVRDADDLGPGRADVGQLARVLNQPDPTDLPSEMEQAARTRDWVEQANAPEQPYQIPAQGQSPPQQAPQASEPVDNLAQLQATLAEAQAEAKRMKEQYARESEKWGNERKKHAERMARMEQGGLGGYSTPSNTYAQPAQPVYYDPRILGDVDPNVPLTAGQTAALLQNMAAAFGQQMNTREQTVIDAARELRNYDLTSNEEADLIERHGWLATLDRASQIKAMRDLVQPLRAASQPAAVPQLTPKPADMTALARARHLTATTFIEPSSRTSPQEQAAATGADSALAKKIAEYKTAINLRPGQPGFDADQYGTNRNVERLLREINALQRRRA